MARARVLLLVAVLAAGCTPETPPLTAAHSQGGACQEALSDAHWQRLQRFPTEFGLDYLHVHSSQPVRVESVTLVGGAGHLRVVEASLAPGGGIGVFTYTGDDQQHLPFGFRARLLVPGAVLTKVHASKRELRENPSANAYQVVVGVIPTATFGSAAAVRVRYRVGRQSGTLVGTHYLAVSKDPAGCGDGGAVADL